MTERTCTVPGCERAARSKQADLCRMHYHRQYRHGSVNKQANRSGISASHGRRYRTTHQPDHPLAPPSGRMYVHRAVLFAEIGYGPHLCHWCRVPVGWFPKGDTAALQVDHLNGLGDDNRAANLRPSCSSCNTARGSQARSDALRSAGWWSQHDTVARLKTGGRARRVA